MNAMSSRAKTFVGSAIATASELPIFRTGMTSYFLAVGAGTRRRTAGSISSWASVIEGTPYWRERDPISCSSLEIGRAAGRERGENSVGAGSLKKKKKDKIDGAEAQ